MRLCELYVHLVCLVKEDKLD